jgi:hypothetical protein
MKPSYRLVVSLLAALAFAVLSIRPARLIRPRVPGGFVYALNQVNGGPNQIYGFRIPLPPGR